MNRIQFFTVTGLSSLLVLLLVGNIALNYQVGTKQNQIAIAQQVVQQGNIFKGDLQQLAVRIYSDSNRTNDTGLKALLQNEQISYTPGTNATETPAAPPANK
jgi:hypothetical protein